MEYRSMLELGRPVQALVGLVCLDKDRRENGPRDERVAGLLDKAFGICGENYPQTRQELTRLVESTCSVDEIDACVTMLIAYEDYETLKSLRERKVNVDDDLFLHGYPDYVDHALSAVSTQGGDAFIGKSSIDGTEVNAFFIEGAYLMLARDEGRVTTPLFPLSRRLQLDTPVFAAGHDRARGRYILTLERDDRVIGVDASTLKTEKTIESPAPGVRGLAVHEGLRRGFFNAEFGNAMFSFDLDSFEIRKKIIGFSVRPERIYLDPASNIMVVGNLGNDVIIPGSNVFQHLRAAIRVEDMAADGRAITLVDADAERVTHTLPAGRRPTAVAISKNYVVAGNFLDNKLNIYNRGNLEQQNTVEIDAIPEGTVGFDLFDKYTEKTLNLERTVRARLIDGAAILERRGWVLLTGFDACMVTIIDIEKMAVAGVIPVQNRPFDVIADDAEKYAFVSCHASDQVSVIDLDARSEVFRLETGPGPVDLNLSDGRLLIADSEGLGIFDLNSLPY